MENLKVKEFMVPLSEYATVSVDATLFEAIDEMHKVQQIDQSHYRHRAVLVYDDGNRVIGKLGLLDILKSLEVKYSELGDLERLSAVSLSRGFIRSIPERYSFWSRPLEEICRDAASQRVGDIMHQLTEIEYIDQEERIDEAIHQLIMGNLQSLIVTRGNEILGILKLSDIFQHISKLIAAQEPE